MNLFRAIIHNDKSIDNVQKLYYLRSFLEKEPLDIIKNLPLTTDSYDEALKLLNDRYNHTSKIVNEHISSLLDLTALFKSSPANIRTFVSGIKQCLASLKNLSINTDTWDPIILAILYRKLDSYTSRAYQLERSDETDPTVASFLLFLEKRALALENTDMVTPGKSQRAVVNVTSAKQDNSGMASERTYLADAISDLKWKRVWPNGTEGDLLPSQREINTSREDVPNIYGSYLVVDSMSPEDYGRYVCVVHSNNVAARTVVVVSPPPPPEESWQVDSVPWRALALGGGVLACVALAAAVLHRRCTPRLRLLVRRARALASTPAQRARVLDKQFDVLVCWTPVDRELVRGALLPTLLHKYKYRAHGVQVPTEPANWYNELLAECTSCRALVAVLSPAQYSPGQLLVSLRQLRALPIPPVVVLLQDLPDLKREAKDSGETLVNILRRTRLIPWRSMQDRDFWTQLRLALPMPPPSPTPTTTMQQTALKLPPAEADGGTSSRTGSLTALVV